jgi:hypothetical protein
MESSEPTQESREPTRITLGMSPEDAHEFIRKLAEDDHFRRQLRESPREVLEREGFTITGPHEFEHSVQLPPKREVRALLKDLGGFDEDRDKVRSGEALGYALYAALWRIAYAMPFIEPEPAG